MTKAQKIMEDVKLDPVIGGIYRIDREGWAFGKTVCDELFVGSIYDAGGKNTKFYNKTRENYRMANADWVGGSFAKEIDLEQPL